MAKDKKYLRLNVNLGSTDDLEIVKALEIAKKMYPQELSKLIRGFIQRTITDKQAIRKELILARHMELKRQVGILNIKLEQVKAEWESEGYKLTELHKLSK